MLSDPRKRRDYNDHAPEAGGGPETDREPVVGGYRTVAWKAAPDIEPLIPESPPPEPLVAMSPCRYCRGRGVVREHEAVQVRLPGRSRGGVFELPLSSSGITNLYLRLRVRVSDS